MIVLRFFFENALVPIHSSILVPAPHPPPLIVVHQTATHHIALQGNLLCYLF